MSKPAVTYMKRELKKVMPVFGLSAMYAALIVAGLCYYLCDRNTVMRLYFVYPSGMFIESGDLFIGYLSRILYKFHPIAVIVLEILLIRKVFYLENRAGVCDFLRILPIRERNKIWMKVCAGESVIFGFCFLLGCGASMVHVIFNSELEEINAFIPNMPQTVNSFAMLWQIVFMIFLSMSAIFLVLFVMQCCIHSVPLATFAGVGILFTPIYYVLLNYELTSLGRDMITVVMGLIYPFPVEDRMVSDFSDGVTVLVEWDAQRTMCLFLLAIIVLAIGMIILALRLRWNIRESNNSLINSPVVAEFILTGFSLSIGTVVAVISDREIHLTWRGMTGNSYQFFVVSLIAGAVVWAALHVVSAVNAKRQRGM